MQFNPLEPGQQGQFGPDQQYLQGQPHQQPPEGTWQPQPPQGYPGQPMYAPQMQQPTYPPPAQQPMYPSPMQQPMYPPQMQQPMYPPQMQQPMYPYPPAQAPMMPQQVVNVNIQQNQPGLFIRALYFLFIGWWAGLIWLNIGYFFVVTIIGLPVGLIMLNRLPLIMTLKPASQSVNINITGNTTNINITTGAQQVNFLGSPSFGGKVGEN
jgi:Inner membrane component domain